MAAAQTELERFFALSVDMLCVLGYDGYYKRVNPAFERTLGFTEEELLARPFVEFVHPDDRAASAADLQSLGSGVQTGIYEERHLHKDGSYRWLHWRAVEGGDQDSCYALARDVTDRKLAESELASSRARIVEAADAARKRIERDLHDGAQQTLVGLSLKLRLIRMRVSDPEVGAMLDELSDELRLALEELRELARGIHPSILTTYGLEEALNGLADRAPIEVDVSLGIGERLPPAVEAAVYFVAAEGLTNVAKYAQASRVEIRVARRPEDEATLVEIADDGIGGADPSAGTGLQGLTDRIAALGGNLSVLSPAARGTTIRAEIPSAPGR
jgi:PAS domain S-box-containing protein